MNSHKFIETDDASADRDRCICGRPRHQHDGMARSQAIARARMANGGKWPDELTSGVMFYEGQRITRDQFEQSN